MQLCRYHLPMLTRLLQALPSLSHVRLTRLPHARTRAKSQLGAMDRTTCSTKGGTRTAADKEPEGLPVKRVGQTARMMRKEYRVS